MFIVDRKTSLLGAQVGKVLNLVTRIIGFWIVKCNVFDKGWCGSRNDELGCKKNGQGNYDYTKDVVDIVRGIKSGLGLSQGAHYRIDGLCSAGRINWPHAAHYIGWCFSFRRLERVGVLFAKGRTFS